MKLLLPEEESSEIRGLWAAADSFVAASIAYVEARAAIARRLSGRRGVRARRELQTRWREIDAVEVDDRLITEAGDLADAHRLRALDAIHLAAAHVVAEQDLVFATWDTDLAGAARAARFAVAPGHG